MNNNERRVEVNDVLFSFSVSVAASSDAVHQFSFFERKSIFHLDKVKDIEEKRLKQVIIFQDKIIKYLEYKI